MIQDRSRTPWVVAQWHAPWYSSYTSHYKETESMRAVMEPLFYAAGVDIVLNGHLQCATPPSPYCLSALLLQRCI